MAGPLSSLLSAFRGKPTSVTVTDNPATQAGHGLKGGNGSSTFTNELAAIAAPYAQAAKGAHMPNVGNPGPKQLANYSLLNMKFSRQFVRTDPAMRSIVNNLGQAVVGTGPTPTTPFLDLLPLWHIASMQFHAGRRIPHGLQVFTAYQEQVVTGNGLAAIIQPDNPRADQLIPMHLKILEAERLPLMTRRTLDGNVVITGIEMDEDEHRLAYWLHPQHPQDVNLDIGGRNEPLRFDAENIQHMFRPARGEAERGEPRAVAAMVWLWAQNGYMSAEIQKKKIISSIPGFLTNEKTGEAFMEGLTKQQVGDRLVSVLDYEYGQLLTMPEGMKINFPSVSDTSGNAAVFTRLQGNLICASMGIPYEVAYGDWNGVSDRTAVFSSTYFETFIATERQNLEYQFLNPTWHRFVDWCVAKGLWTPPPGLPRWRWYEVEWTWPVRSYKHPVQDIAAKLAAMKAGLIDRDTLIKELGYDPNTIDLRQCMAMLRARLYGLEYESHIDEDADPVVGAPGGDIPTLDEDGKPVKAPPTPKAPPPAGKEDTDEVKRLEKIMIMQIDRVIREIEQAEADKGLMNTLRD